MEFRHEFRYAARCLWKDRKIAGAVAVCLALGIGANAAMFDAVDTLLFRPPPMVQQPSDVVRIYQSREIPAIGRITSGRFAYPVYEDLGRVDAFEQTAAYFVDELSLGRGQGARKIRVAFVTPSFFDLLGVKAEEGRLFAASEGGAHGGADVMVASRRLLETADPSAPELGRDVAVGQGLYRVIGILPGGFRGLDLEVVDAYLPIGGLARTFGSGWEESRGSKLLEIVGRLGPGVSSDAASLEATALLGGADEQAGMSPGIVELGPLSKARGPSRSPEVRISLWLGLVSVIVLLLACVNVSNLLLSRAVRRQREDAIRCALGAPRKLLVRQALVESVLLAGISGLVALGVLGATGQVIWANLMPTAEARPPWADLRTLGWTMVAALVAGLASGVIPALRACRPQLQTYLQRSGGRGECQGSGERLRQGLLACQVALAFVLILGAGLFVQSLHRALETDLGLDSDRLLVTAGELSETGWEPRTIDRVAHEMLERVRDLPEVEQATLVGGMPFKASFGANLRIPGREIPTLSTGGPYLNAVGRNYFQTVGATLRRGDVAPFGREGSLHRVAVVNETMARQVWSDEDPIGDCIKLDEDIETERCTQVVGVVDDIRRQGLREEPTMQLYIPLEQAPDWVDSRVLLARTRGEPTLAARLVGGEVRSLRRDLPFLDVQPMSELLAPQLRPWKLGASVLTLFGGLALVLGLLGVYSLVCFQVAERRRELGLRLALGATSERVRWEVARQGMGITLVGIFVGSLLLVFAARTIQPLLYGTTVLDLSITSIVTGTGLVGAVWVASLVPARGLSLIDPARCLRGD